MTSVPTDMALHTTCIAGDFVHQLFACHVGVRLESVLPLLALDVPTMLACRQLARALADAYLHPIELNLDMIRYNEALNKRSTGRLTKHEEALLQKFPHGPQILLDKPSVLVDSGGRIILWYLPDAISLWIQGRTDSEGLGFSSCAAPLTRVCALNFRLVSEESPKARETSEGLSGRVQVTSG
ncbi:hypothetical protein C8R48DRAFT_680353 [Suillus tomentosus]|nr:hypothetical protein C8R48DRAFT_680353 [Suillus tomentosus]